jgi:hypothetical protein
MNKYVVALTVVVITTVINILLFIIIDNWVINHSGFILYKGILRHILVFVLWMGIFLIVHSVVSRIKRSFDR